MSNKKTVLVTGANGLLGRQLLHSLQSSQQYGIEALVRQMPSAPIPNVNYRVIDLSSNWPDDKLPSKVDAIIHLAQSPHFRDFPSKALDVFAVNVASTARLLDYANRVGTRQFLYASSGGVYGSGSQVFRENSAIGDPGMLGYYLGSKLSGETLVQSYAAQMQVVLLRFFFIYGADQNRSMLIPRLVDSVKNGKPITLAGKSGLRINPVHVADAATAVAAALGTRESAIYNVAGDETVSLRELCHKIESLAGKEAHYVEADGGGMDIVADISAMKERLHKPVIRLDQGLRDLL